MVFVLSVGKAWAQVPYRVAAPADGKPHPAVLLVPGCSGFISFNGINLYDERADALQAAGFAVVFVDFLAGRRVRDCAGGRDISHADVGNEILEAASWAKAQTNISGERIFVIGWSFGAGGVLHALASLRPEAPLISKAVMYYPDCRSAKPWTSAGISALMLMGAADEVALPTVCDLVIKGAPADSLRTIVYPGARHVFDARGLPERARNGAIGYNAEAAQASWDAALQFLK